jgi:guanyl-specific ribonuclease Sa
MFATLKLPRRWVAVLAIVATLGLVTTAGAGGFAAWAAIQDAISLVPEEAGTVYDDLGGTDDIEIVNFGEVVYVGPVDVSATLDRVRNNQALPHPNDGSIFTNVERLLPPAGPGYYREFVHWPFGLRERPYGMSFPGPMRVILGQEGEVYFTGDHYASFDFVN